MAKTDRQIRAHNSGLQNIRCLGSYRLNDFLLGSCGNLMVTGGSKNQRRNVLLRQIELYRSTSNSSVVVFSDDEELKTRLIAEAEGGTLGRLYVVNGEYNNYDFFFRMPLNLISEYFGKIAQLRGSRDTASLLTFTDAFLRILKDDGEVNLSIMKKRLMLDNSRIRSAASRLDLRDMVEASSEGASLLRSLTVATCDAFAELTYENCVSRLNLLSKLGEDCVFLVDIPKTNHNLFAEYFALVLRSVMNRPFKLVLDDEIMLNNKSFFGAVELLKQRYNVDVVKAYDNILAMQPDGADILKNINRQAVFLNGNMPATDLQTVLTRYGQFTAMEAVEHREKPPAYLFTFLRGRGETAATYQRDRALLQSLSGEVLLSKGSNAEILAVKKLIV